MVSLLPFAGLWVVMEVAFFVVPGVSLRGVYDGDLDVELA